MAEEEKEDVRGYMNGVFYFSNNSDEDFKVLWNSVEYTFPAKTCSPMLMPDEPFKHIQEIRKRFAYQWAEREWYKGSEYKKMAKMGGGLPPTRDDKTALEPLVEMCLNPLPIKPAITKKIERKDPKTKGSKAVGKNTNLNHEFKDDSEEENLTKLGIQPE